MGSVNHNNQGKPVIKNNIYIYISEATLPTQQVKILLIVFLKGGISAFPVSL